MANQYSSWYARAAEDAQLGRQKMMQDADRAKAARQAYSEYASQFATSPETAARYPEVERVAKEAASIRETTNYLMSQGLGRDEAEGQAFALLNAQKEANIASVNEKLESLKEDAKYQKEFSDFKTKISSIDYQNLSNADEKLNQIMSDYSHLAGAHNADIANSFDKSARFAQTRVQGARSAAERLLPKGIALEEAIGPNGRITQKSINDALASKLSVVATGAGEKAGAVAGAQDPYKRGLIQAKGEQAIQTAKGMIPVEVEKQQALMPGKVEEARQKSQFKNVSAISQLLKTNEVDSTPSTTQKLPSITRPENQEQPTASEVEPTAPTPLPSPTLEATTEQAAPTQSAPQFQEGQRIRQGNAIYEIRNGQPVQVQ